MRIRPPAALATIAAMVLLLSPSLARADFQTLFNDYRGDGNIYGCDYSESELRAGLTSIPSDVRQYDTGFADAINLALQQAATGCNVSPSQAAPTSNQITAADGSPGPGPPKSLALGHDGDGRDIPAILVAMMVALGAALGAAAALFAARHHGRGASSASQPNSSGF